MCFFISNAQGIYIGQYITPHRYAILISVYEISCILSLECHAIYPQFKKLYMIA